MHNTTYLRLYILTKVNEIQKEADSLLFDDVLSVNRAHELQGKLEILKEMFEDLKLEQPKDEDVEFHRWI
jgi:hypothetical protein